MDHLVALHGDRTGVGLSCRDDYPAAQMWPRLDFEPLGGLAGRSREGHRLTRWWRDFNHPTLFSALAERSESLVSAALDTDVFLDLVAPEERADPRESLRLLDDWVIERAELFITKEISVETTEKTRRMSLRFPRRDVAAEAWEPIAERLGSILAERTGRKLSPHDESDVRHIARAAAAGGGYFLTRDRPLRRRLAKASIDAGIRVVSPGEFLAELDVAADYSPVLLEDTTFSMQPIATFSFPELVSRFLNYSAGERKKDFESRFRQAIAHGPQAEVSVVADDVGQPVALFARHCVEGTMQVPVLRVAGSLARTLSRHLVHMQRAAALERGMPLVRVVDPGMSTEMPAALLAEGFVDRGGEWCAHPTSGVAELNRLPDLLPVGFAGRGQLLEALSHDQPGGPTVSSLVAQVERQLAPLKVTGAGITTYLVPIKPHWAAELFDRSLSESRLFSRAPTLGMSREHVYYSANLARMTLPARLVWYVSGDPRRHIGAGTIRAVSKLDEAVIDRPDTLFRRYKHLGVWRRDEVYGAAKQGRVLAMRFSDTELFVEPLSLGELKQLYQDDGRTPFLQSKSILPEHTFARIYQRGTRDAH